MSAASFASRRADMRGKALFRCVQCNSLIGSERWESLPLCQTLTVESLSTHVRAWPKAVVIEVRRCRCGRTIARTRLRASAPDATR